MKENFVELANEWEKQFETELPVEALIWAGRFAQHLDAQGYKPTKSRWVKFEATADSVCPVPGKFVKLELAGGMEGNEYRLADTAVWNTKGIRPDYFIIRYKVKK